MKYLFILLVSICLDTYSQPSNPCKACFPAQAGQAGKFLQTNGHKAIWAPVVADSCICTFQNVTDNGTTSDKGIAFLQDTFTLINFDLSDSMGQLQVFDRLTNSASGYAPGYFIFRNDSGLSFVNGVNATQQNEIKLPDTSATLVASINGVMADSKGNITLTDALPYYKYVATLNQTGTDDPVANVLENNIGAITWTRLFPGGFKAELTNGFVVGRTVIRVNVVSDEADQIRVFNLTANQILFDMVDAAGGSCDCLGTGAGNTSVEIIVYK